MAPPSITLSRSLLGVEPDGGRPHGLLASSSAVSGGVTDSGPREREAGETQSTTTVRGRYVVKEQTTGQLIGRETERVG